MTDQTPSVEAMEAAERVVSKTFKIRVPLILADSYAYDAEQAVGLALDAFAARARAEEREPTEERLERMAKAAWECSPSRGPFDKLSALMHLTLKDEMRAALNVINAS